MRNAAIQRIKWLKIKGWVPAHGKELTKKTAFSFLLIFLNLFIAPEHICSHSNQQDIADRKTEYTGT